MQHVTLRVTLSLIALTAFDGAVGQELSGRYVGADDASITLTLSESASGAITGSVTDPETSLAINALRRGDVFFGTVGAAGASLPLSASVRGDRIVVTIGPAEESMIIAFTRATAARDGAAAAGNDRAPGPVGGVGRRVFVNGQQLTDAELAQVERGQQARIQDANYWYDRVLGAWGIDGGPTLGFVAAGLDLGGPLSANASGGGTGVFVNGRELHPIDMLALQRITGPIVPGRYFIPNMGLAGLEGGPPLWNLSAMAAQSQSGGVTTWQGRMSSGFSDGTTGAVFLPNGGIVSTGE
jgi:hypothetical protein